MIHNRKERLVVVINMLISILKIYSKIQFKYIIKQKMGAVNALFFKWFKREISIPMFLFIKLIQTLVEYFIFYVLVYFLFNKNRSGLDYIEMIELLFSILFFVPILNKLSFLNKILIPLDSELIFTTSLKSKQIFLLNYLSQFLRTKIKDIPFFLILTIQISQVISEHLLLYWILAAIIYLCGELLGFITLIVACKIRENNLKRGYGFHSFLFVQLLGISIFITTFLFSRTFFSWISTIKRIESKEFFTRIITEMLHTIKILLKWKRNIPTMDKSATDLIFQFESTHLYILFLWAGLILLSTCFTYKIAGSWYRTDWRNSNSNKKDWIYAISKMYLCIFKNLFTKVQVKQLFNNKEELATNYSLFFFNYFNYIWIGVACGAANGNINNSPIIRLILIHTLFNIISRDYFSAGIVWFPSILRFDGEGRALSLYRLAGENLYKVYEAKITLQRFMGIFDFVILFSSISFILNLSFYEYLFVTGLSIFNFFIAPHLKTLPSYIYPHIERLHFTETGEYIENKIWEKNIENNIYSVFLFLGLGIPLILLMTKLSIHNVYFIGMIIYLIMSVTGMVIINVLLNKITPKVNEFK